MKDLTPEQQLDRRRSRRNLHRPLSGDINRSSPGVRPVKVSPGQQLDHMVVKPWKKVSVFHRGSAEWFELFETVVPNKVFNTALTSDELDLQPRSSLHSRLAA